MAGKSKAAKKRKFHTKERINQESQHQTNQRVKKKKEVADAKLRELIEAPANADIGDVREREPQVDLAAGIVAKALYYKTLEKGAELGLERIEKEIPMETLTENVKRMEKEGVNIEGDPKKQMSEITEVPFDPKSLIANILKKKSEA